MTEPRYIEMPIDDIELLEDNPRDISTKELTQLEEDIKNDQSFLQQRPPLLNHDTATGKMICYAGNQRIKASRNIGKDTIHVWVQDDVPKAVQNERMLKDNLHRGEWDYNKLTAFNTDFLLQVGFNMKDLEKIGLQQSGNEKVKNALLEKFIVPPFSIIDTRQGYWQSRKQLWFKLGIKSHESREGMETTGSLSGSVPGYYRSKEKCEGVLGYKITNEEFEEKYLDEYMDKESQVKQTDSGGMLSIFDPVLCEVMYKWFGKPGFEVLDPFAGGSVRGIVAQSCSLNYTGIDLREDQVISNYENASEIFQDNITINWIHGNSLQINELTDSKEHDLLFTCPPYYDLEKYSEDPEDLSNLNEYVDFITQYEEILSEACQLLKENRFACIVVGEIRSKSGSYFDFVGDTKNILAKNGLKFYNDLVLITAFGSAPIRAGRAFNATRKCAKVHQNIIVFYKGDMKAIKEEFGEVINVQDYLVQQSLNPNMEQHDVV